MEQQKLPEEISTQIDFQSILTDTKNYSDIQNVIQKKLAEFKEKGVDHIGFVSGKIEGEEDRLRMRQLTIKLREEHKFPIFASTDIFDTKWKELEETKISQEARRPKMLELFREILGSGVTDIFMMEGWQGKPGKLDIFNGAIDEYQTAKMIGLTIHNLGGPEGT